MLTLKLDQVKDDRFEIEDAKTASGRRTIPIHSAILDRVATLRESSTDGYLLSGLTPNKYGDRSNAVGKRFGRLKSALGYGRPYVFHSFRKGVATQFEQAGIPENEAARLLGHEFNTMTYGLYSGGNIRFKRLKEILENLDWAGEIIR
jgi:integrase